MLVNIFEISAQSRLSYLINTIKSNSILSLVAEPNKNGRKNTGVTDDERKKIMTTEVINDNNIVTPLSEKMQNNDLLPLSVKGVDITPLVSSDQDQKNQRDKIDEDKVKERSSRVTDFNSLKRNDMLEDQVCLENRSFMNKPFPTQHDNRNTYSKLVELDDEDKNNDKIELELKDKLIKALKEKNEDLKIKIGKVNTLKDKVDHPENDKNTKSNPKVNNKDLVKKEIKNIQKETRENGVSEKQISKIEKPKENIQKIFNNDELEEIERLERLGRMDSLFEDMKFNENELSFENHNNFGKIKSPTERKAESLEDEISNFPKKIKKNDNFEENSDLKSIYDLIRKSYLSETKRKEHEEDVFKARAISSPSVPSNANNNNMLTSHN